MSLSAQSLIASWLVLSISFWVASALLPGVHIRSPRDTLVVAGIFGLVNALLGKLLFVVLGAVTFGLLYLVACLGRCLATAILLRLTGWLTPRLSIAGAGSAVACALVMSVVGTGLQYLLGLH